MKIVLCFLLELSIYVNSAKINYSKSDRLRRFRNYHNIQTNKQYLRSRPSSTKQTTKPRPTDAPKIQMVQEMLCTAQICSKCLIAFRYPNISSGKIQTYCSKILQFKNCCPMKLLLRFGF